MNPFFLIFSIIFIGVPWMAPAQSGREGFFPEGFSQPKMAVGNGGAIAIAGPTPFFKKIQETNGSNAKILQAQQNRISKQNGNTDLMNAATSGDLEMVKQLLDLGADVNATNKFGSTALMGAASGGYFAIIEELVEHKARVNTEGKDRSTALMFAVRNGHVNVVEYLIEHGAYLKQKNKQGKTALNLANDANLKEIAEILKEAEKKSKEQT